MNATQTEGHKIMGSLGIYEYRCNCRPEYTPGAPAELYQGLKRPRLDYTRVYYGLGQFIPTQAKLYLHYINHDLNNVERYTQELLNFSTSY